MIERDQAVTILRLDRAPYDRYYGPMPLMLGPTRNYGRKVVGEALARGGVIMDELTTPSELLHKFLQEREWTNKQLLVEMRKYEKEHGREKLRNRLDYWFIPEKESSIRRILTGTYDEHKPSGPHPKARDTVMEYIARVTESAGDSALAVMIREMVKRLERDSHPDRLRPDQVRRRREELACNRLAVIYAPDMVDPKQGRIDDLGAWANVDIEWTIGQMKSSREYYRTKNLEYTARLNLSLALAYREPWAHAPQRERTKSFLVSAKECATEALEFFEVDSFKRGHVVERAAALDRRAMVEHLAAEYGEADTDYDSAMQVLVGHGKDEQKLRMVAWIVLNRLFLRLDPLYSVQVDEIEVHANLRLALGCFEGCSDANALWHVIAAAACFAATRGDYALGCEWRQALPEGDAAQTIGPTYYRFLRSHFPKESSKLSGDLVTLCKQVDTWLSTLDKQVAS